MPIYDYECPECGRFEKMQRITADPLAECPVCGQPVKRLISKNVGILFKGAGFYQTDARNAKARARELNKERQKDNQAILDGDIKGYVEQSDKTDSKACEI